MTESKAADYLDLSVSTLQKWRSLGTAGPRYLKMGGQIRYRQADLDEFIEESIRDPRGPAAIDGGVE